MSPSCTSRTRSDPAGRNNLLAGAAAGSDTVIVTFAVAWTATANEGWLRTASTDIGSGLAAFTFNANIGCPIRSGTLTIAGQTLAVAQAAAGTLSA